MSTRWTTWQNGGPTHEQCAAFWVWLYAERRKRGMEPTDDEKRAVIKAIDDGTWEETPA